ncbi:MAG: tetratricopeptide repeat protein [Thiotrichales bacterium]
MNDLEVDVEMLRTLSEIGYMACFKGLIKEGEAIMEGVFAAKPGQIPVQIGLAVARINAFRYEEAINILQNQVLTADPDNATAKTFLALAMMENGNKSAASELFEDVKQTGTDDHKSIASAYQE